MLDSQRIRELLDVNITSQIQEITIYQSIDSTNSYLMRQADAGVPGGSVCLAHQQTAGRGRHGCTWVSPPKGGIYLSVLWRYTLPPKILSGLSLACGVATARALSRIGLTDLTLKWPNDVLWNKRKLAGLLLEVRGEASGPSYVVVGLGLNLSLNSENAAKIDQPWADLDHIPGGMPCSRNRLIALLLSELAIALMIFGTEGLGPFFPDWTSHDAFRGERIRLLLGDQEREGEYLGITHDGALRLAVDGVDIHFYGGEVRCCRTREG